jgi:hypothetical protein
VTNAGARPLADLRAQLPEGAQATLVPTLAPGKTAQVDAPVAWAEIATAGSRRNSRAGAEDLAMFAAASRSFPANGQVAVVGRIVRVGKATTRQPLGGAGPGAVVVSVGFLEGADFLTPSVPSATLVARARNGPGTWAYGYELVAPPGSRPLALAVQGRIAGPQAPVEVYDWRTRTWAVVNAGHDAADRAVFALSPSQSQDRLVRVRTLETAPANGPSVGLVTE